MERTRQLYERLLDRTKHLKVWVSYAQFEASAGAEEEQDTDAQIKVEEDSLNEQQMTECIQRCRGNLKSIKQIINSSP